MTIFLLKYKRSMQPDTYYHVYSHANGSENLFRTSDNYNFFLRRFVHYICPIADTYACCLMPNHFHFLVKIRTSEELVLFFKENPLKTSKVSENLGGLIIQAFSNLLNSYTKSYNKVYKRKGSLFIPNFKKKSVESDSYFTGIIYYIHANPVKHGFVKRISDWPHSSYHTILSEKETKLKREEVLDWFYGKEEFVKYHEHPTNLEIDME